MSHRFHLRFTHRGRNSNCQWLRMTWEGHDDVIQWKHFPHYCPFVRGIHWSPVNSPHKGQLRGPLMFSLICVWRNGCVNNGEAGDKRRHRAHYDVTVMGWTETTGAMNYGLISVWNKRKILVAQRNTNEGRLVAQLIVSWSVEVMCCAHLTVLIHFSWYHISFDGKGLASHNGPPSWIFGSPSGFVSRPRATCYFFYQLIDNQQINWLTRQNSASYTGCFMAFTWEQFDGECSCYYSAWRVWKLSLTLKWLLHLLWAKELTQWGRLTNICVSKLIIIGSDNGLAPGRRQAIVCTNVGIWSIGP